MENLDHTLPEIKISPRTRAILWRELLNLARAHDQARSASEKRRIDKLFDALLLMLSIVAVAAPLLLTAAARASEHLSEVQRCERDVLARLYPAEELAHCTGGECQRLLNRWLYLGAVEMGQTCDIGDLDPPDYPQIPSPPMPPRRPQR
jgi:hypothetical protein